LNEPNKTPGKMKLPRALELINALIDHMINDEGGHSRRVIGTLLDVGFTAEELTESFCSIMRGFREGPEVRAFCLKQPMNHERT